MYATRIRAVTLGLNADEYHPQHLSDELHHFYSFATKAYQDAGFTIQTRRITLPIQSPKEMADCYRIKSSIDSLSRVAEAADIRWFCLPFQGNAPFPDHFEKIITNMLSLYPKLFVHFLLTSHGKFSNALSYVAARTIAMVSRLSSNGYDNFRIGVGANIKPNTPYFPFSYHEGASGFSLALELIEQLIQLVKKHAGLPLPDIREQLINAISPIIQQIDDIGKNIEQATGFQFKGQDISIAPFPGKDRSVATLIELLGPAHCGQTGTLMITSLLTDVLKTAINRTRIQHTGFNGVMFSLLEDEQLANANNHHYLSLEKLMLYASVCGCGLDMIPVPGDIFEEELHTLILDISALSTILNKPLGMRVLPIPAKSVNELTNFNHDFLTNTRIMSIDKQGYRFHLPLEQDFGYLRFDEKELTQ